jgi:hypothetical protein
MPYCKGTPADFRRGLTACGERFAVNRGGGGGDGAGWRIGSEASATGYIVQSL